MHSKNYHFEDERHVIVATCQRCLRRIPYCGSINPETLQQGLDDHQAECQPLSERFFKVFFFLFAGLLSVILLAAFWG